MSKHLETNFFSNFSCCIICEHPKNDLALNGNMFPELVPKSRNLVETSLQPQPPVQGECDEKISKECFLANFPPKKRNM